MMQMVAVQMLVHLVAGLEGVSLLGGIAAGVIAAVAMSTRFAEILDAKGLQ